MWIFWVVLGVTLSLLIIVQFFKSLGRIVPINYIIWILVTIGEIYIASCIASFSDQWSVFFAMSLVTACVMGLLAYSIFAYEDYSLGIGLISALAFMIPLIVILLIFFTNRYLLIILTVVALIVFSIYFIINV
jgi:hypothetical protein